MAPKTERTIINAAGLAQGIVLVTFPAASTIFTDTSEYGLSSTQYGAMFLPQVALAIAASLLGAGLAGRIVVGADLSIPGHPEILVTGDVMSLDKLPGVAEVAMQTGLYAGRKVARQARGEAFGKPVKYRDVGSAAYISRGKAVVSAFGLHFGGFLGWWVWLFIHIGFLTGYRN